jgi:hypothetical protein
MISRWDEKVRNWAQRRSVGGALTSGLDWFEAELLSREQNRSG